MTFWSWTRQSFQASVPTMSAALSVFGIALLVVLLQPSSAVLYRRPSRPGERSQLLAYEEAVGDEVDEVHVKKFICSV